MVEVLPYLSMTLRSGGIGAPNSRAASAFMCGTAAAPNWWWMTKSKPSSAKSRPCRSR
ncbi:Uncharacterised protein [Mycobacteroides abscessus subsp. abscessus]|nr:Uncharacterised protein [Mycobacteroides abscessus subsp. abscessus]